MSQLSQSRIPENLVANIVDKTFFLDNISENMIDTTKSMGANEKAYGAKLVWLIECADSGELVKKLIELHQLGFIFKGGNSGYSAGDMFALLLEKRGLSVKFKEIWSRGPGDWFIIER
ncbi:MAG: hypothetical protein IPJ47_01760 [Anaerolineales bacterium]|nr:hypothetical protein [Anaerolineales bacterium]